MGAAPDAPELEGRQGAHGATCRYHAGHGTPLQEAIDVHASPIMGKEEEAAAVGLEAAWEKIKAAALASGGTFRHHRVESLVQGAAVQLAIAGRAQGACDAGVAKGTSLNASNLGQGGGNFYGGQVV